MYKFWLIGISVATMLAAPRNARADCNSGAACVFEQNTGSGTGLEGVNVASTGIGVYGVGGLAGSHGSGIGVKGESDLNYGVYGKSNGGVGGYFTSVTGDGLQGLSTSTGGGNGVLGTATSALSSGVAGINNAGLGGYGVWGHAANGYAVYADGTLAYTGSLLHVSDERLKKNIKPLSGSLEQLMHLRGVSFEWKDPSKHGNVNGTRRGFIAQEFEQVFPEWVSTNPEGFKIIDDTGLFAVQVESIRALKSENDGLRVQLTSLESRVRTVESARPREVSFGGTGMGIGAMGLAFAGTVLASRRKRSQKES